MVLRAQNSACNVDKTPAVGIVSEILKTNAEAGDPARGDRRFYRLAACARVPEDGLSRGLDRSAHGPPGAICRPGAGDRRYGAGSGGGDGTGACGAASL